jgi:predicted 2-oxoglutarate/Fe(II)-dependent dioxygenase YbiX
MDKELIPYTIIKGYMDKDFCKFLANYFLQNQEEDPREFYATFGLGSINEFFRTEYKKSFDPDNKIKNMVNFAYDFFSKNYPIKGEFNINRSHANLMFPGAVLHDHEDDRSMGQPLNEIGSTTYVAGLFLTDDYEGGELVFNYTDTHHPEVGDLVLFPGWYTRHGVKEVTSGVRINILTHFFDVTDKTKINPDYPTDL